MSEVLSTYLKEHFVKPGYGQCGDRRHITYASVEVFCGPLLIHRQEYFPLFEHPASSLPIPEPEDENPFIKISIRNSPNAKNVIDYIIENKGTLSPYDSRNACNLGLKISPTDTTLIRGLANRYREAGMLQHAKMDSHWRYTCPRIAESLEKLAEVIETFISEGNSVP